MHYCLHSPHSCPFCRLCIPLICISVFVLLFVQILEVSLGERVNGKVFDLHLEALKRLATIVAFMAEYECLTVAHIQRMWKSKLLPCVLLWGFAREAPAPAFARFSSCTLAKSLCDHVS